MQRVGMAQILELKATSPDAFVTARNRDRPIFQPWAILGGMPGKSGSFKLNPGQAGEVNLGNTDMVRLSPGDVLQVVSPSGAGRGDPYQRVPEAVLRDWQAGRVTEKGARDDYGVVLANGVVDLEATESLRSKRKTRDGFDPGPTRSTHEQRWTPEAYAILHEVLATVPVSWRALVKKRIFAAVKSSDPKSPIADIIRKGAYPSAPV